MIKVVFVMLVSSCLLVTGRSKEEVIEHLDITYITYGDRELNLNLYRPAGNKTVLPGIVGMHGGAWVKGSRIHFSKQAKALAEEGYVAVSISYRPAGEAPFPALIQDCQAAVRWLKANAEMYGVDASRIGATGFSAGGQLAALTATAGNSKVSWPQTGNMDYSAEVQASVVVGGQSDMETERIAKVSETEAEYFYRVYLGGSQQEVPETYRLASPLAHLDKNDPPTLFIAGEHDDLSTRADGMRATMDRFKIPNGLFVIEGAPHNLYEQPDWFALWLEETVSFFDQHLKGR